jgi:hypothetical protein
VEYELIDKFLFCLRMLSFIIVGIRLPPACGWTDLTRLALKFQPWEKLTVFALLVQYEYHGPPPVGTTRRPSALGIDRGQGSPQESFLRILFREEARPKHGLLGGMFAIMVHRKLLRARLRVLV